MKLIRRAIERFKKKYPLWLEAYLIRKHLLFPESKQYNIVKTISSDLSISVRHEEIFAEVIKVILDEAWQQMFIYMRYGWFPDISMIELYIYDRPGDFGKVVGLKWVMFYKHHQHLMYMQELMEKLDLRSMMRKLI